MIHAVLLITGSSVDSESRVPGSRSCKRRKSGSRAAPAIFTGSCQGPEQRFERTLRQAPRTGPYSPHDASGARNDSVRRWPAFTPAARQLGAGAVFAFPLIVGAIRAGVLGLYRDSPGPMPDGELGDLLILADAATVMLLGSAEGYTENGDGAGLDGQAPDLALHRAEIDQATGMLTVQLGVPATEAFARLRAYAYAQDRRLADVAGDIVARRLRLPRDPGQDGGP
jgi:ANTAR domain